MSNELEPHLTADDLGAILRRSRRAIVDLCREESWPHVKVGKQITFTPEQAAQIVATHTVVKTKAEPDAPVLAGLTARSAARSA